ncbi:UNVERIFIED_CONTAM: hypothetical protein NCL1_46325 [Trichonephila clavipes]
MCNIFPLAYRIFVGVIFVKRDGNSVSKSKDSNSKTRFRFLTPPRKYQQVLFRINLDPYA